MSGRKRAFDEVQALNAAMYTFWKKGFVGTSLADLTANMGINKPSMYASFGNKEDLFLKATQHYVTTKVDRVLSTLDQQGISLRRRLKAYMVATITVQTEGEQGLGCFLSFCESEVIGENIPEAAKQEVERLSQLPHQKLKQLFETDPESIVLGLDKRSSISAQTILTFLKGCASMARSGTSSDKLVESIDIILDGLGLGSRVSN